MRILILSLILSSIAFATNIPNQISFILDAGQNTFVTHNSGAQGGDVKVTVNPGSFTRLGITYTQQFYEPPAATTYTSCAVVSGHVCGDDASTTAATTFNQEWGITYRWVEHLQSDGSPFSPRQLDRSTSAWEAQSCDVPGALPLIEPATITTAPIPMPVLVGAGDCAVKTFTVPLAASHTNTGIAYFLRGHNLGYRNRLRWDNKARIKLQNGNWIYLTEANTNVAFVDEMDNRYSYDSIPNLVSEIFNKFKGVLQVKDFLIQIPDNQIQLADTTLTTRLGTMGTDGNSTFWRLLEGYPVDYANRFAIQSITCVSNVCTAAATGSNLATGASVLILNMDGPGWVLNGGQFVTTGGTNSFVFTPHAKGSGGSRPSHYVIADDTYTVPVNRAPGGSIGGANTQITSYGYKMLVAATAFDYPDGSVEAAPAGTTGADIIAGAALFNSGTLYNANMPIFNYRLNAKCVDCHSHAGGEGWDLSYLKAPNEAIIFRSMFHGMTFAEGRQVAAYIRSNDAISSPPYAAYWWNPPFQPGAGQGDYTWTKADSTLTSISASSAVCTINGLASTTNVRVNDPVYVSGATASSDVDLNTSSFSNTANFHVTGKTSTTVTFGCPSVANSGGYTESTLRVEMANSFAAGAGIDAKINYPFDQIRRAMGNFASTTQYAFNKYIDDRIIPSHFSMPDWAFGYLPNVHPLDAVPDADYFNSTPYLNYQTMYTSTPGNYASFISNYNSTTALNDMEHAWTYYGRDIDGSFVPAQNIPTTTKWVQYRSLGAGIADNSTALDMRYSVQQLGMIEQFTLATKFGAIAMTQQINVARSGAPTSGMSLYNWQLPAEKVSFNMLAPHKSKSVSVDSTNSWFDSITNAWYRNTLWTNAGSGVCQPDTCIDSGYIPIFDAHEMGLARPTGYEGWMLDMLGTTQKGRMMADMAYSSSSSSPGQDWLLMGRYNYIPMFFDYGTYWWFTAARFNEFLGIMLEQQIALFNSRSAGYWQTTISNLVGGGSSCTAALPYYDIVLTVCDGLRVNLTYYTMFLGAANSNVVAFKALAAAIIPAHNFDLETTSATQADAGNTNTPTCSGCGTNGSHTATFTFATTGGQFGCPFVPGSQTIMSVISGSTDTSYSDVAFASGGTCASVGGAGTITYTLLYAHSGTYRVDYGCSSTRPQPNYIINGQTFRVLRCSVQF